MFLVLQFIIGPALVLLGLAVWRARWNGEWREWFERKFLDKGEGLFDKDMSYSGHVQWIRYAAIPTGLAITFPTQLGIDILIGIAAAGLYYWMGRQKIAYEEVVRQREKAEAD